MEAACASRVTIRRSAVADAQAGLASHVVGVSRQEDSSDLANVYSPVLNLMKSCTAVQPEPIGDLGAERNVVLRDQERELAIRRLVAVFVEGEHVVSEAITPRERHVFHHPR